MFCFAEDKVFYESKKRKVKRHLQAAELDAQAMQQRRQQRNACALQILHHTLHLHSATLLPIPAAAATAEGPQFMPSKRLQELFEQYMLESDSDSDMTSSVDYDALVFGEDANLFQSLQHVWSMCANADDLGADLGTDDIELDVDYDALLDDDAGHSNGHLCTPEIMRADNRSVVGAHDADKVTFPRTVVSTPNCETIEMQEK